MTQKPLRTSPCTPPADPGSAAVVAHASESSSGAGNPLTLKQFQSWLLDRMESAEFSRDLASASSDEFRTTFYTQLFVDLRVALEQTERFKLEHFA